jgi:apolipoprotein D and lipocalin family protein
MQASPRLMMVLASLAMSASAMAGRSDRLGTDASVDLKRYMGAWHVIANIPYFAERGKVATRDEYALREDGRIENVFVYRKAFDAPEKRIRAIARVLPDTGNAHWKVRFFGVISTHYLILDVDPDYRWALIGHPTRKYAWVFGREAVMDEALYQSLLDKLERHGYERDALKRVPQLASQVGQPGFQ